MTLKQKGLLAALSANTIWGFTSIPIRLLRTYPPEQILFFRIIISLAVCWTFILSYKKESLKLTLKAINTGGKKHYLLVISSGLLITLNWYAYIYVVNYVNLNTAAFAYMICPLITAVAGFIILKEEVSRLKFIAIGLALISIIALATGSFTDVLWSVITAAFYAFYLIVQRVLNSLDKIIVLGLQLIIAFVLTLPFFHEQLYHVPVDLTFWILVSAIAIVFTLIPLFLSLYALESLPSSTVGILIYINPVVAFSIAFLYFHESINPNQVLAYSLLVIAVIVFNWKIINSAVFRAKDKIF
jgi:chloramphenicol-sensitive protein RarD